MTLEIMLGILSIEGKTIFYEELYYDCVLYCKIRYYEREREKTKLQRMCCRLYPFILQDDLVEGLEIYLWMYPILGEPNYIGISLALCLSVLILHLLLCYCSEIMFSNTSL